MRGEILDHRATYSANTRMISQVIATSPPPRPAHLFAEEQGEPQEQAQLHFLHHLARFADPGVNFEGACTGRIWVEASDNTSARLAFTTNLAHGVIHIALAENGWLRAELIVNDVAMLGAWIEDPYEEKAFWPDGADGVGEAPGRISKRGAWLYVDCTHFPGVPANAHGYWQVEAND